MESMALLVSMNMISFAISQTSQSNYSSLFVASKAISTSNWETYKTESQPSNNLIQCLARCELHQSQWANGQAHPGFELKEKRMIWKIFHPQVQRYCLWVQPLWGGPSDCSWGRICRGIRERLSHSLEWWKVIDVQDFDKSRPHGWSSKDFGKL